MSFFTDCPTVLIAQESKRREPSGELGSRVRLEPDSNDHLITATNDVYRLIAELDMAVARLARMKSANSRER